jgi:glutamyl/glutaminyl-tRNA synthetase
VSAPRLRFAIAPDANELGIEAARDALFSWLFARSRGGTFLLKSDVASTNAQEAERLILDDLCWLGLGWDEGIDADGARGPYRRSERLNIYVSTAADLLRRGLAYRCFCPGPSSREEGASPAHCLCRESPPEEAAERQSAGPPTILFKAGAGGDRGGVALTDAVRGEVRRPTEEPDDFLLIGRNGEPGHEFAVALDDAMMEITHVASGSKPGVATSRQALVHASVGTGAGPVFIDLPPIDRSGEARTAATIGRYRREGYPPEGVLNYLGLLGAATSGRQELLTREEMLTGVDPGGTPASGRPIEPQRLQGLAVRHMGRMSPERLAELASEHLAGAGLLGQSPSAEECAWAGAVARLYVDRLARMSDLPAEAELFFRFDVGRSLADAVVRQALREPDSRQVIESLDAQLGHDELTAARFRALVTAVRRATGAKGKDLYEPLRIALTGYSAGPDLAQLIPLIERGRRLSLPQRVVGCSERAKRLLEANVRSTAV